MLRKVIKEQTSLYNQQVNQIELVQQIIPLGIVLEDQLEVILVLLTLTARLQADLHLYHQVILGVMQELLLTKEILLVTITLLHEVTPITLEVVEVHLVTLDQVVEVVAHQEALLKVQVVLLDQEGEDKLIYSI
jgi:hypothetical protein